MMQDDLLALWLLLSSGVCFVGAVLLWWQRRGFRRTLERRKRGR